VNYSKKIVCLASSRRPCGRCIAGREVIDGGYGGWIRPVSARPSAELTLKERCYENDTEPQVLDIIDIPMIGTVPHAHQTENHMIDATYYWTKQGAFTWADLADLVDRPGFLWGNGDSTHHGMNDRMHQALASQFAKSLFLIEPEALTVQVQTEVGALENPTRRVRADFWYHGTRYNFIVTDPLAEQVFLTADADEYRLNNVYLTVSLSEAFEGDRCCHKLVDAIIGEGPLYDSIQHAA
jgi:hypothetical protein